MALTDKLIAIADAIRGKTGKTDEMTLDQMVTEISGIEGGGGSGDFSYVNDNYEMWSGVITVGPNTVANLDTMVSFFASVRGVDYAPILAVLLTPVGAINNELIYYGTGVNGFKRIRDGVIGHAGTSSGYDLKLAEGAKYHVVFQRWIAP
mgnify:CR=1 FL=1